MGGVKDPAGASVTEASVTVRNTDTNATRVSSTDSNGQYRLPALPAGHYAVKVGHPGFKTEEQSGVVLEIAQESVLNFVLSVGTSTEIVDVQSETPMVETTNGSLSGVVNEKQIVDLPLNGRNYIDLTLLQPGIAHAAEAGGTGDRSVGLWFSSNGAPPRSNNIMLDGARILNSLSTTSATPGGTTLGVDGIQEYRVITDTFGAEYGMSMGSQIVLASKGGTNHFHGDVFEFIRNNALDARNYFDYGYLSGGPRLPPFHRNNFGGAFGGPIQKDRTYFYAVYEGLRQSTGLSILNTVLPTSCYDANHKVLATNNPCASSSGGSVNSNMLGWANLFPYPNVGANEWTAPAAATANENYGQIRLDHTFSVKDTAFSRYTIDQSLQANPQEFPQFVVDTPGRNQFLTVSETHVVSPSFVNTSRLSFSRTNFSSTNAISGAIPTGYNSSTSFVQGASLGTIDILELTSPAFGVSERAPSLNLQNVYTLSEDVNFLRGKNAWKFGVLFNRFNIASDGTIAANGTATFPLISDFLMGNAVNYQAATPGSNFSRDYIFNTFGFYAQDDLRLNSRLTLNIGLRYEFETTPRELNGREYAFRDIYTDTGTQVTRGPVMQNDSLHNFSPRIGFAWDISGNGKTALRGGFGEYFDVANFGSYLLQQDIALPPLSTASTASGVITFPFTFSPAAQGNFIHSGDYYIKQPHLLQYNLNIQHQLPGNMALTVAYVGSRGLDLFTVRDQNPYVPTSISNGVYYWNPAPPQGQCPNPNATGSCRINPNFGPATMVTTGSESWYNSGQVTLAKHVSHGLEFQGSYTWSRSLDTAQAMQYVYDCFSATGAAHGIDPFNQLTDKGPSCFDIPNNFRLSMLYHFPNVQSSNFAARLLHGWWMGNIVSIQSGYPFSPNTANLLSNSGVFGADQGERPNVVTAANLAGAQAINPNAVVFNPSTVNIGNVNNWFNENMFTLAGPSQTTACPANNPLCSFGYFGDASRNLLRGPGLRTWDLSFNKDTALPWLGEAGRVQFRVEMFNLLNHANLGLPGGTIYAANQTQELPISAGTQITATSTTSREIQLSMKIIF
jgi:hypothetical protein